MLPPYNPSTISRDCLIMAAMVLRLALAVFVYGLAFNVPEWKLLDKV
jgi:hypothetical protein